MSKEQYIQLRSSEVVDRDSAFFKADGRRRVMVEQVANSLFATWFPNYETGGGPKGDDFQNWHDIACLDAQAAVKTLIRNAWIDDPTMD
jgi:hypothetical protein